jgi:fructoselysine and glucoselysine-specific PTS system IID component
MNSPLLTAIFWRSLLIQGAWNYQGMQHLGFLWSLLPVLRQLPVEERREALQRAAEFYNAHPYLCGYLLGAAANLESSGQGPSSTRLKKAALTPLGTVGDRLFWAGLRPLSGMCGILAFLLLVVHGSHESPGRWLSAIGVAVLATLGYNLIHLSWRRKALRDGHELGLGLAGALRTLTQLPLVGRTGIALALAAGMVVPLLAITGSGGRIVGVCWLLGAVLLSWQLPSRGWALPALLAVVFVIHLL